MTNLFASVVGQNAAKRKVGFYLEGYQRTRKIPYLMYTSQKGSGKTLMALETAKGLSKFDKNKKPIKGVAKPLLEINATAIKSESHLINSVLIPHVVDKDITVFIDEAHNLKYDAIS